MGPGAPTFKTWAEHWRYLKGIGWGERFFEMLFNKEEDRIVIVYSPFDINLVSDRTLSKYDHTLDLFLY